MQIIYNGILLHNLHYIVFKLKLLICNIHMNYSSIVKSNGMHTM